MPIRSAAASSVRDRTRRLLAGLAIAATAAVVASTLPVIAAPAFAAECTITGTSGDDAIVGTEGADIICGGDGNDTIDGVGGDDIISGGSGRDTIRGGAGSDTLYGENEADILIGGDGDDTIDGGVGDDTIDGGDGDDTLIGGNESDTITGGAGNDTITGETGADRIDAGDGDDTVSGGNENDTITGGAGNDGIHGDLGEEVLDGGPGDDTLYGDNDNDTLFGGSGNDRLFGMFSNDRLFGGPGNDALDGGNDDNRCDGGTGTNTFAACSSVNDPGGPDTTDQWADTDGDGAPDAVELRAGSSPTSSDSDGDGISDGDELVAGTNPLRRDSDGNGIDDAQDDPDKDGIPTAVEILQHSRPGEADSDDDGLGDGQEAAHGTNALAEDSDQDGVTDGDEVTLGSDPTTADSDGDGILDGEQDYTYQVADGTPATLTAIGSASAVLAATLDVPDDARLADTQGQRAPPVEVTRPEGISGGTLSIPFNNEGLSENADVRVLVYDETTNQYQPAPQQYIDSESGVATVDLRLSGGVSVSRAVIAPTEQTLATQYLVVDVADFERIWAEEITTPRVGHSSDGPLDVAITLDSSGSMAWNDPDGARRTASKAFVDALVDGDRSAVVDFDDSSAVLQTLTTDRDATKAAIDRIDDVGGTNLSAGLDTALDELDANGDPTHNRVIVFLTDGEGYYSDQSGQRAIDTQTTIYTVGLGSSTDAQLLDRIATQTGGQFYLVANANDLDDAFGNIANDPGEPDADADGLSDTAETKGWRDGTGHIYKTDPTNADSDADGLSDGDEANTFATDGGFGRGTYYSALSNPLKADTDGDGLDDLYEVSEGLSAWRADIDHDGLNDYAETQVHSTEAFSTDTDIDGFSDAFEIQHVAEGYDPLVVDTKISALEYAGDFARGAICGDIETDGFCKAQSVAYLIGNLASGYVGLGDIRDLVGNLVKADFVSAGLSIAGIVPFAGDAASTVRKVEKFIRVADDIPSAGAFRAAMRDITKNTSDKIDLLRKVAPDAVTKLKAAGIDDAVIARIASRAPNAEHFNQMVKVAADIRKAPSTYRLERSAENYLRSVTPGAAPKQRVSTDGQVKRFFDVLVPANGKAIEVKHGTTHFVGRAASQAERDAQLVAGANRSGINSVEWHFFTHANNSLGPDQALLERLTDLGIPYVIWVA